MRDFQRYMLNQPKDISKEFGCFDNTYFNADSVTSFDCKVNKGKLKWKRYLRKYRMSFNCITAPFEESDSWEFPPEYDVDEEMNFSIDFINDKTIRLRFCARDMEIQDKESIMFAKYPLPKSDWNVEEQAGKVIYSNKETKVILHKDIFNIEVQDKNGNTITSTYNMKDSNCLDNTDPTPFSYVRRVKDLEKNMAATFKLQYDEKIYGCGESFTRLNKRGQKLNLWTYDALGAQSKDMYKPIPFFLSNKGYGMFVHSSTAMTFDFGCSYDEAATLYVDDDFLDLFIFIGSPKEIIEEYTAITGRASMPPMWSFGLWMSRITYDSENQARDVAHKMRNYKIPCDVIHLDTGWFQEDWKCNYKFSDKFDDAEKMIKDLNEMGYRISLWQLPYITPTNELFKIARDKGYAVLDGNGNLATEDAIIDFSNENAVNWYKGLLEELFKKGVGAIKVDFGEGAPYHGYYASHKTGRYEHNLYPLRYNKAVDEITSEVTGEHLIWARSAWAGSQRYPLHWGGDAEITDSAMAATLRGGLSLGLCGFTFWSHDIGGFTKKSPRELYSRWLPFGMLTSHSRCHGWPPKEPWEYDDEFVEEFRKSVELKYSLIPYIRKQAMSSLGKGYPLMRTMFFEYPEDETAWLIEDEYFFGENLLVAPLMKENSNERKVYIPEGIWVDYFTKEEFQGEKWYTLKSSEIPIIILVKKGAVIEKVPIAQCVRDVQWDKVYTVEY